MRKLEAVAVADNLRAFAPVTFSGSSRLTFRRLRRPTPLPTLSAISVFSGYLGRLNWLFGGR